MIKKQIEKRVIMGKEAVKLPLFYILMKMAMKDVFVMHYSVILVTHAYTLFRNAIIIITMCFFNVL